MPSGGDQTSTTTTEPPSYVKPYLVGDPSKGITGVLPEAQKLYESNSPQYFQGNTVAGFNPYQIQSQEMTAARAQQGMDPLNAQAGGYLGDVVGGKYLGGQSLSGISDSLWSQVQPRVNSAAGLVGRGGSGAHEGVLGREFTNALAPYAFNQYNQERGMQQQAAMGMPGFTGATQGQDYLNAGMLGQVGQQQQQQSQLGINADINKWNYEQNLPQNKLNQYLAAIYGAPGSTSSTSTPGPSTMQTVLGGLLGLGGLGTGILGIPGVM